MKNLLKYLVELFTKIVAFLIHPLFIKSTAFIVTSINTNYIVKQLKICGTNPKILFPITSHGLKYIAIGANFYASSRLILEAYDSHLETKYSPEIIIGNNVRINYDCHIGCVNKVLIGDNVLIASKVFITDHFHGDTSIEALKFHPNSRKILSKGPVIIEDNVWIGEGVTIMPNVTIGKNSIIGANSVVTKDVPKYCVVAGNPAKIIKNLNIN